MIIDFAGNWVRAIAGASMICAAAMALTPSGRTKGVLKLVCGLVLVIAMIEPLMKGGLDSLSLDISEYRRQADEITGSAEIKENGLSRTIIEDELGAYILDKAAELGIPMEAVAVALQWGESGCWYPYEVRLTGRPQLREKELLEGCIEAELGVPRQRQYWSEYEG